VVTLVFFGELGELFVLSSVAVLVQYAICVLSLVALAVRRRHGLDPRHAWPAPLALGALVLAGEGARGRELWTAGGVLGVGALILVLRRRRPAGSR
jgi:hypothetical protein